MHIDFFKKVFNINKDKDAIVWNSQTWSYKRLLDRITFWEKEIQKLRVSSGSVVCLKGDFSPETIALFFVLIENSNIIVPILNTIPAVQQEKNFDIAQVELIFNVDSEDQVSLGHLRGTASHEYFQILREEHIPGLVLFTSGSSGTPKAAVHNFNNLLKKFKTSRPSYSMVNILGWDHWGGLNTMLHILSNAGTLYTLKNRTPEHVCKLVEEYRIEVLPASPTFLNMLLISSADKDYDLSSLKVISYGAEPMPNNTLIRLGTIFPGVKLQQTYGSIEWGVARSQSKSADSLWVKIGGDNFEWRVVEGMLQIRANSLMIGYLNAPSPFTEDGWYITGDAVEVDGEYLKILGRTSEIINVGGEKVYPAELENILQEMHNVKEVTVFGEKHPITGNIVCARFTLSNDEPHRPFSRKVKHYCRERLPAYKVPVKITISETSQTSQRLKKMRKLPK
jgi:long-chain acyl-CoA synthetase